jgi:hypothetical protein
MPDRKKCVLPSVAALVFGAAALTAGGAQAVPLSLSGGAHTTFAPPSPVEQVACWRFGRHGWGWYPFCGPPPAAFYDGPYYRPGCRDVTVRERRAGELVVRHIHRCD